MSTIDNGEQTALGKLEAICAEIYEHWDKDQRPGKLLAALAGSLQNYRKDVDEVRAALRAQEGWRLVPEMVADGHCTPKMAKAGRDKLVELGYEGVDFTDSQHVFAAMIAAAPQEAGR